MTDPYDIAAARLLPESLGAIKSFWAEFETQADRLDAAFSGDGDIQFSVEVMQALNEVSPDLMWEFGPSDKGHRLCITAEWRPELRPLARAMINLAPTLDRWEFIDARPADHGSNFEENFQARFRMPVTLSDIQLEPGFDNKVEMTGTGIGSEDEVGNQTLLVAGLLLGEQVDWDWFGDVETNPVKRSFFSRLSKRNMTKFPSDDFVSRFHEMIEQVQTSMPDGPYSKPRDDTEVSLLKLEDGGTGRADMITFTVASMAYANATLKTSRFSSVNHSRFGEWFLFLRIPRTVEFPFGQVSDRAEIEDMLQEALSIDQIGGVAAAGHGREAVYIDLALTDIDCGLRVVNEKLKDHALFPEMSVHFLEAGLPETSFPLIDFGGAVS